MAVTDFHDACIVCLGVKHAFDAVYSPGGSQACPACDLFSLERRKVRLDNVRAWIPPQPADAHSDPVPRWVRGPSTQQNNNSTNMARPGSTMGSGAPRTATSDVGGSGVRSEMMRPPPASRAPSPQSSGPEDEESQDSLPSFQMPADIHMVSPGHDGSATGGSSGRAPTTTTTSSPAARSISFQAPLDLYSVLRASDSGSVASEAPQDPMPSLEVFRKAAERTEVPWPTAAPPQTDAAALDPMGWPGLRPPPAKPARITHLPAAKGFQTAFQSSWMLHKHPPRYRWILELAGAAEMGAVNLPPMDRSLAFTLDSYHRRYAESYAKAPAANKKAPGAGYNIKQAIPFLDKSAHKASKDDRQLYEVMGFLVRDMNALSLLLSSLRSILAVDMDKSVTPEQLEQDRLSELSLRICQHVVQWHGRVMDMLVAQERDRWLDPLPEEAFPDGQSVAAKLRALNTSAAGLFEGGMELLHEASKAKKQQSELSESLSLPVAVPAPAKEAPKAAGKPRGRSNTRKAGGQDYRMPSASPAPQHTPAVASVVTRPPPQQRPRSQSRGRDYRQGK